jgi:hypothetical protein
MPAAIFFGFPRRIDYGAAGRTQSIAFTIQASDDAVLVRNLEETKAQDVWSARGLLIGGPAVGETPLRGSHA